MKRQKRDRGERAYSRGYLAGLQGRSRDNCPFEEEAMRQTWMNGWREGRDMSWQADTVSVPMMRTG
jgi:ribosome modulation factor